MARRVMAARMARVKGGGLARGADQQRLQRTGALHVQFNAATAARGLDSRETMPLGPRGLKSIFPCLIRTLTQQNYLPIESTRRGIGCFRRWYKRTIELRRRGDEHYIRTERTKCQAALLIRRTTSAHAEPGAQSAQRLWTSRYRRREI